ncbi:Cna B-type domain-containing protein, partial [Bacillus pseudomycoides]|uniref:Cna B-type domain-containing protein n=1 Tax=Bacillus pseudomycoides TaxID=64104 RepID=UPI003D1ECC6F
LLQNGQKIDTKEVSEATGWKYTFKDLAAYDANGVAYKYEVKEQPVAGYQTEVNGYDITNTKIKDEPGVDPDKDPDKDPNKDPNKDPDKDPNKDPNKDPDKDPNKDPNTNTNINSDPKVPPTKENDKTTALLPKTGGTPTEMISIIGGMVLFVLGGFLFVRQRMR